MDREDLAFASIETLAPLLQSREVSSAELTRNFLERIDRHNEGLSAYITVMGDHALRSAQEADDAIARGEYRGPMHGIPIALKDQVYTKGVRTTAGSSVLADFVPDEDATIVKRLDAAGAVLLGKLNLNEFAMGGTLAHTYGEPRNPWNPAHAPGGSSSGSGIAVAAGLCHRHHRRGHRRLHPQSRVFLRPGGREGQQRHRVPPRHRAAVLVAGHRRADDAHRARLRLDAGRDRRSRRERPAHLAPSRARLHVATRPRRRRGCAWA